MAKINLAYFAGDRSGIIEKGAFFGLVSIVLGLLFAVIAFCLGLSKVAKTEISEVEEELWAWIQYRAGKKGYTSASEYLSDLLKAHKKSDGMDDSKEKESADQ